VSVRYGEGEGTVWALRDVSLTIRANDSAALLGRSGSGTTTLLHVLGGLAEPSSGTVEWQGAQLSALDWAGRGAIRAGGIGYVFQGANLIASLTAFENIAFAAHAAGEDAPAVTASELLELVGLSGE